MDQLDPTPKPAAIVEGDTIRVPNPNRNGAFVSFEIEGLTDEARMQLAAIDNPTRSDLRAAGVTMSLLPDPETSALSDKNKFVIENKHIKTNLEISDSQYKKLRQIALDAFLDSRKKRYPHKSP